MRLLLPLGLGFVLGLRHSFDGDHIVAVTTIVSRHKNLLRASIVGIFWGLGHTLSLFVIGALIIGLKVVIPESVSRYLEMGVGAMLIVLGADLIRKLARPRMLHSHFHAHGGSEHEHAHLHEGNAEEDHEAHEFLPAGRRPFFVGIVHGLAGSAAIILLLLPAMGSAFLAALVLASFGLGMMVSMGCMAGVLGLSFTFTAARSTLWGRRLSLLAGAGSVAFGLLLIVWQINTGS